MASYSVEISMSQSTVDDLSANNFILYGFKAVKSTLPGAPLVWFQTTSYGIDTDLNWEEKYQAYTSTSSIVPGGVIKATNPYSIDLGQTLKVTGKNGTGSVDTQGTPGAISILNETTVQFTCGISELDPNGAVTPMCAFPLFGNNLDVIAPIERILLMFSTTPVNTGTVIFQAYSPGVLIDLTGVSSRSLSYDINLGWIWDSGAWARQIGPAENLVPLLIENPAQLSQTPRVASPTALPGANGHERALAGNHAGLSLPLR